MDYTFKGTENQKIERKYFKTFVEVDGELELQGKGIEESPVEPNYSVTKVKDIVGFVDTYIEGSEPQQSFDPNIMKVGDKLSAKLVDIVRRRAYSEMSQFTVVTVWEMLEGESDGVYEADREVNCTIEVSSIASGTSYVGFPFNIHYSNNVTAGTVSYSSDGAATFTAATDGVATSTAATDGVATSTAATDSSDDL